VIGGGPAGYIAAIRAAQLGMHAQNEHSPPTSSASTIAMLAPQSTQRPATFSPAAPPPITTTSNCFAI